MDSTKQWVQHISGQGEKWKVAREYPKEWGVEGEINYLTLPKSEYHLCDPPEVWRDVTEQVEAFNGGTCDLRDYCESGRSPLITSIIANGYRLRKVRCCNAGGLGCLCNRGEWAFIVEKKVSE